MFKTFIAAAAALLSATAFAATDVNKASQAELEKVKGIGPATSMQILSERKKSDFKSWDDFIARTRGVGDKSAEKFADAGLTLNGASYAPVAMKPEAPMSAKAASAASRAASATKAVASKAASAVKSGAGKVATATKAAGTTVKENAKDEVAAGKENFQEAKEKRAAKKAAAAASAPMKK